ncbi:hypothetical protein HMPREF0208_04638 [Citrobacter koseri]|nr:hypothetical protein HMPREF3220_04644 [Citrobacter koseri]KWZ98665.1 hypothetical protein HMPREF3207_04000 [Citrobacter koseri]KXB39810.1 hypothetical protein HMPREF0208_04638 [Citrobacter koseri]
MEKAARFNRCGQQLPCDVNVNFLPYRGDKNKGAGSVPTPVYYFMGV